MPMYSTFQDVVEHTVERRKDFFRLVFGNESGYVCIAYKSHIDREMREDFFHYPEQLDDMCENIDTVAKTLTHVYFCPQLLSTRKRTKGFVSKCTVLWSDLDRCNPQALQVHASIVVQTSAGRWQALWRLEESLAPDVAEELSRRIAYFHAEQGADKSGWDLTQLLRVPYTPNYKYGDLTTAPIVVVTDVNTAVYRVSDFSVYPEIQALKFTELPMPEQGDLPKESAVEILQRYRSTLNPHAFGLVNLEPTEAEDWSKQQWKLVNLCVEAGLTKEETFVVLSEAKCNKYIRDSRHPSALWREVTKAYVVHYEQRNMIPTPTAVIPDLITEEEIRIIQKRETFVERYIKWASEITDAAPQYHQAGAFTLLSAVISGSLKLPTSFGIIRPNMWFLILADTTLTRKSTAMDIAMGLLEKISPDFVMANDGSPEGILSAMKARPRRASIYWRDEFTGLLDQIANKDYMSGMMEHLTKLYDGKSIKRLLRKEEINIQEPIFIILAGGIKTKTQELMNEELINSGFAPRFVFITAEADISRVRPVGPPRPIDVAAQDAVRDELFTMYDFFNRERLIMIAEAQREAHIKPDLEATMTPQAWERYNKLEHTLTQAALDTGLNHLTPVYDRLAKSTLKAAMLIAASQVRDGATVEVTEIDLIHAIYYCRYWQQYVSEIVNGLGKNADERVIDKIVKYIENRRASGATRAEVMRLFSLDSRRADLIMTTIIQRRLVSVVQVAGQPRYVGIR